MSFKKDQSRSNITAILQSLIRNKSGNTLAMVAAGLVPMTAMIGSGVDISRAYMVQTRLQQACDAGVLAGRRAVGDGSFDTAAADVAGDYFNVNFPGGYLNTTNLVFTPTAGNGDSSVNGVATVTMPTVVMDMFTIDDLDISVDCQAQLEVANSDITFVLDTTGSMACPEDANSSECSSYFASFGTQEGRSFNSLSTTSRLGALRSSLDSFYNIVQGAAASSNARIRYSFVPYSQTVNTGYLLNPDWIVDSYDYETAETTSRTEDELLFFTNRPQSTCSGNARTTSGVDVVLRWEFHSGQFRCAVYEENVTTYDIVLEERELDVSTYKTGAATPDPTNLSSSNFTWAGCIEERDTVASDSVDFVPSTGFTPAGLLDLDIDGVPTSDAGRWRPYWPEAYVRRNFNTTQLSGSSSNPWTRSSISSFLPQTACPQQAALLAEYGALTDIQGYTNTLRPDGGTYHDIGLIWGARLSSPDGLFQVNVNETPSNLGFVGRHLIFMTDGDLVPSDGTVSAYGIERHDGRISGNTTGTSSAAYSPELFNRHTTRYTEMCEAIKAKGIRVWVIAFNTALTNELTRCASTDSSFTADDASTLNDAFASIAEQIAELRLTQ